MSVCLHEDYDDYFGRCDDCKMTTEQIHQTECVLAGFDRDEIDDETTLCSLCGVVLEEVPAA